jgi:ribosome-associated toxin RatA of RatAB toxin-antitoxin module
VRHGIARRLAPAWLAWWLLPYGAVAAAAPGLVTSTVAREGAAVRIDARIVAAAPLATCWAVAVDFERVAEFIPGVQSSRVVSAPGDPLRVRQVGRARVAFFSTTIDVTQEMQLDAPRRIAFRSVAGNMRRMSGQWEFDGDASRCTIDYRASIEPSFWIPPVLGPLLLRGRVEQQLAALVAEIERRAAEAGAPDGAGRSDP